ncbi:hypothetical protein POTOM_007567 [Populus tomentosa]|uniref:Pentatricopeptide repeat-containing protein n=1 Tax=Populus tomentosa TaxID=118781 RepID=A0A8X8D3F8_POPTO|nr:hypothetical protein POTOM_007567 [Populus tomentosa]
MVLRSTVSWNSVISRYVGKGRFFEATDLFRRMKEERTKPSELTMVSLLNACACLGALGQGEWIHDYIVKNNFALNAIVVTAIIDGLAMNGRENEAVQLFSMLESSNCKPDHVSFLGVMTACDHGDRAGLLEETEELIRSMPVNPEAMQQRFCLKEKQIDEEPGCSSIEVNGEVHELVSGGRLHRPKKSTMNLMIWDGY